MEISILYSISWMVDRNRRYFDEKFQTALKSTDFHCIEKLVIKVSELMR